MQFDYSLPLAASEILISKICHDLVSPVGAVNNGIEFLQDMGEDGLKDGLDLMQHAAGQASVKLQLFRLCFGAAGGDAKITGKMVYETYTNYIAGTKLSLDWDLLNAMPDDDLPVGCLKILLNALLLVGEAMPKGGDIIVTLTDQKTFTVKGQGERIKPKDGVVEALSGDLSLEAITPQNIQGFMLSHYAKGFGLRLDHSITDDTISVMIGF